MEFVFGIVIALPVIVIYSTRIGRDERDARDSYAAVVARETPERIRARKGGREG